MYTAQKYIALDMRFIYLYTLILLYNISLYKHYSKDKYQYNKCYIINSIIIQHKHPIYMYYKKRNTSREITSTCTCIKDPFHVIIFYNSTFTTGVNTCTPVGTMEIPVGKVFSDNVRMILNCNRGKKINTVIEKNTKKCSLATTASYIL